MKLQRQVVLVRSRLARPTFRSRKPQVLVKHRPLRWTDTTPPAHEIDSSALEADAPFVCIEPKSDLRDTAAGNVRLWLLGDLRQVRYWAGTQ